MRWWSSASLLLGLCLCGGAATVACGHTETHQALLRAPEPPTNHPVELYMADQPTPARSFYEIALVEAIGFGDESHPDHIAKVLTDKAQRLGCDAVLHTFLDQGYARAHAAGVCVKWLGPAPEGAVANAPLLPAGKPLNPTTSPSRALPTPKIESLPSSAAEGSGR